MKRVKANRLDKIHLAIDKHLAEKQPEAMSLILLDEEDFSLLEKVHKLRVHETGAICYGLYFLFSKQRHTKNSNAAFGLFAYEKYKSYMLQKLPELKTQRIMEGLFNGVILGDGVTVGTSKKDNAAVAGDLCGGDGTEQSRDAGMGSNDQNPPTSREQSSSCEISDVDGGTQYGANEGEDNRTRSHTTDTSSDISGQSSGNTPSINLVDATLG